MIGKDQRRTDEEMKKINLSISRALCTLLEICAKIQLSKNPTQEHFISTKTPPVLQANNNNGSRSLIRRTGPRLRAHRRHHRGNERHRRHAFVHGERFGRNRESLAPRSGQEVHFASCPSETKKNRHSRVHALLTVQGRAPPRSTSSSTTVANNISYRINIHVCNFGKFTTCSSMTEELAGPM